MDTLRQDLKFAFRMLVKDRGFAVTAIITLALCIGANSALFTMAWVLLRPLPYPQPDRLVITYDSFPGAGVEPAGTSVPNYVDRAKLTKVFDAYCLYQWGGFRVGKGSASEGVSSMSVTPSFFRVLRAAPPRAPVHRRRRTSPDGNKVDGPQPRVCREAGRRHRRDCRARHSAGRPALSRRRYPPGHLHVPQLLKCGFYVPLAFS